MKGNATEFVLHRSKFVLNEIYESYSMRVITIYYTYIQFQPKHYYITYYYILSTHSSYVPVTYFFLSFICNVKRFFCLCLFTNPTYLLIHKSQWSLTRPPFVSFFCSFPTPKNIRGGEWEPSLQLAVSSIRIQNYCTTNSTLLISNPIEI